MSHRSFLSVYKTDAVLFAAIAIATIDVVALSGTAELPRLMYFLNLVVNPTKQQTHLSNAKAKSPNAAWITA